MFPPSLSPPPTDGDWDEDDEDGKSITSEDIEEALRFAALLPVNSICTICLLCFYLTKKKRLDLQLWPHLAVGFLRAPVPDGSQPAMGQESLQSAGIALTPVRHSVLWQEPLQESLQESLQEPL